MESRWFIQLLVHGHEWMIRPEPFLSVSSMLADNSLENKLSGNLGGK
jgi:hypothetical protein